MLFTFFLNQLFVQVIVVNIFGQHSNIFGFIREEYVFTDIAGDLTFIVFASTKRFAKVSSPFLTQPISEDNNLMRLVGNKTW